jgi:hypothetical protein
MSKPRQEKPGKFQEPKPLSRRQFVKQYSEETGWTPSRRRPLHNVLAFFYFLPMMISFVFMSVVWILMPVYAFITFPFKFFRK